MPLRFPLAAPLVRTRPRQEERGLASPAPASASAPGLRVSSSPGAWLPPGSSHPLLAALLFRLVMLIPAWNSNFVGDESGYLYLAYEWARTGSYDGQWPPLQALFLRPFVELFPGHDAVVMARVATTLLSVWTGAWIMIAAKSVSGDRVAYLSGWIWALYLPLIPFAHIVASEGLFMALLFPAIAFLLRSRSTSLQTSHSAAAFAIPGALLGLACLTREAGFFWLAALAVWTWSHAGFRATLPMTASAMGVFACWAIPSSIHAGEVMPLSRTAGINSYLGWNIHYVNFDLRRVAVPTTGVPGAAWRASLLEPPTAAKPWEYDFTGNLLQRDRRALRRGVQFLIDEPTFIARTRLVKAADAFTPISEFCRCLQLRPSSSSPVTAHTGGRHGERPAALKVPLGGYSPMLASSGPRTVLAALATLSTVALFLLAIPGTWLFPERTRPSAFMTSMIVAGWCVTASTSLVVAMARLRAPFEALLILPAAITIIAGIDRVRPRASRARWSAAALTLAMLALLWYLSIPAVLGVFERLTQSSPL